VSDGEEEKIADDLPVPMVKGAEFYGTPVLSLMVRRQFVPAGMLVPTSGMCWEGSQS
jgi:hypothetical protein